jgi:hypothetical protein
MDTLGLLGFFDFDGFPSGGDIATDSLLDAMCVSTFAAPERSRKVTLPLKTVNCVFFLITVPPDQRQIGGLPKKSV